MADLIQIKGGSGDVPTLQDRELAIAKTNKELHVGINGENVRLCGAEDVKRIEALETQIKNITARLDALGV